MPRLQPQVDGRERRVPVVAVQDDRPLRDARQRGYTEPDPRVDLSGLDVALGGEGRALSGLMALTCGFIRQPS